MFTSTSSARSARLSAHASTLLPGGVSSSLRKVAPSLAFTRAAGGRVWDADGNEYVDFHAAFGPIVLGHRDPFLGERVRELTEGIDLVGLGSTELEVQLAEKIRSHVPSAEQVLYCSSGSEATYHAIRLARAATGRPLVVKFQGCYHGWHDYIGANVISPPEKLGTIDSTSDGTLPQALEWLRVLPFNDAAAFEALMAECGDRVAAVIVEPVLHTIGCVVGSPAFLASLRRRTEEAGSVLIFDEVVTGFRHALGGYQQISGIRPDLTTFAKAIANGYPLGVLAGRRDLMSQFNTIPGRPVMFGGTYNGHPQSVAAAIATIEALEADGGAIHRRLYAMGGAMRHGLAAIGERLGLAIQPTSFGSVFVCYFTDRPVLSFADALTNDEDAYVRFHRGMIERGYLMIPLNLKRSHFMAAHTDADVAGALEAAEDVLTAIAKGRTGAGSEVGA
jgi:glutamate-1-semialdehyde 2,1-aminomutase